MDFEKPLLPAYSSNTLSSALHWHHFTFLVLLIKIRLPVFNHWEIPAGESGGWKQILKGVCTASFAGQQAMGNKQEEW